MSVRTVSFDLDGVLIQNPFKLGVGPHLRAHVRGGAALADLAPDDADRRIQTAVNDEVARRMVAGDLAAAYDWDAIFGLVAKRFGAPPIPDVADLVRHYCAQPGTIWLLDGATTALARLADAGFRLVVATNGFHRYQVPVLDALGILPFFDDVRTPDGTGFAKPDPRMLDGLEGHVGHVGDMLYHDVLIARRLGVPAVWVAHGLPPEVAALPAAERMVDPRFLAHFDAVRAVAPYREAHPEAVDEDVHPNHVVVDVGELEVGWFVPS